MESGNLFIRACKSEQIRPLQILYITEAGALLLTISIVGGSPTQSLLLQCQRETAQTKGASWFMNLFLVVYIVN